MLRSTALITFLSVLMLTACKKDKQKTTQEKIVGTWKIESVITKDMYQGTLTTDVYTGIAADYIEFKNDGTAHTSVDGYTDNPAWGIVSDAQIWMDTPSDKYDIKALADNQFILYNKDSYGTDYTEVTINLKK
jgi:hypothetical protein